MQQSWAYWNGRWVHRADLAIDVDDLGFLVGATVTERLRTFRGQVFRLDEHLRRLERSLEIVGLPVSQVTSQIRDGIEGFIERNHGLVSPDDDWSISAFATPGLSSAGPPTVCVHGYPLPFQRWANQFYDGVRTSISDIRQISPRSLPPELKCRSRMHYYLADQHAAAQTPGARAILLDETDHIAESTTANILIYRDDEGLLSPSPEHILFGVSLGVIEELAGSLGIPFVTRPITVDEFKSASEAMLASTSVCLLPIVECDGQQIGGGRPGSCYHKLLEAWSQLVGVKIADQARTIAALRQ